MNRPGFAPTRRNRNIGTAKQGHGQDNRLVIPRVCRGHRHWAGNIGPHQQFQRVVANREVIFLVEETRAGVVHACSVEDISHLLGRLPPADWRGIETVVLRQPTRKQGVLRPAWGRMFYEADLGLPGRGAVRQGPAVMLEAQDCGATIEWSSSLDPEDAAELDRLRNDGHEVIRGRGRQVIRLSLVSVRATQLYRTLLHEIGHWVDYLEKVQRPADRDGDYGALSDAYFARPAAERDAFAYRYAEQARARLAKLGIIPFDPIPLKTRSRA